MRCATLSHKTTEPCWCGAFLPRGQEKTIMSCQNKDLDDQNMASINVISSHTVPLASFESSPQRATIWVCPEPLAQNYGTRDAMSQWCIQTK